MEKKAITKEANVQRVQLDLEEVKISSDSEKRNWEREKIRLEVTKNRHQKLIFSKGEIERLLEEKEAHVCATEGGMNFL